MKDNSGKGFTITLDDDPIVAKLISQSLGLRSIAYTSITELINADLREPPVACFIDLHLGGETKGIAVIPTLRKKFAFCPILVITADPSESAVGEALASGADDFVQKPIRPQELAARLQTRLMDQWQKKSQSLMKVGDAVLDRAHRSLRGPKGERYLSDTEVNLFICLSQAHGTVVERHTLKSRCWGQIAVSDNALDRKVYEVRRALKEIGSTLHLGTSYGVGFSLEPSADAGDWVRANEGEPVLPGKEKPAVCAI